MRTGSRPAGFFFRFVRIAGARSAEQSGIREVKRLFDLNILCLSIKKKRGSFKRKDDEKKRDSRLLPKKGENLRFILGKVCKKDLLFLAELGTIKPRLINI